MPLNKRLYLLSWTGSGPIIHGLSDFINLGGGKPLILNSGQSVYPEDANTTSRMNGYLVDENYFAGCGGGSSSSTSILDSTTIANMIAGAGGGGSFGDFISINSTIETQASTDGFLCGEYSFSAGGNSASVTIFCDTFSGNTTYVAGFTANIPFGSTAPFFAPRKGDYNIPIKKGDYFSFATSPYGSITSSYFVPLEGGGSSSSASNATIDSLSQVVSNLDSALTTLTSQFIFGCNDITACNYDVNANFNDGSCAGLLGCMDTTAINYNSLATCDDNSCNPLSIGDTYEGGIVFYLDGFGGGLTAAIGDQSTGAKWGCKGTSISGAAGTGIGTGNQNTINIVSGCNSSGIAADICVNLILNGYNDWFLPSRDELELMYINLKSQGLGYFSNDYYWSSSEWGPNDSWYVDFFNGNVSYVHPPVNKDNLISVRAIRAF